MVVVLLGILMALRKGRNAGRLLANQQKRAYDRMLLNKRMCWLRDATSIFPQVGTVVAGTFLARDCCTKLVTEPPFRKQTAIAL